MKRTPLACLLLVSFAAFCKDSDHWPQFRGSQARGVAESSSTPTQWTSPKWKTPIPGLGLSCPTIWGDRIFITTAAALGRDGAPPPSAEELKIGLYGDIKS